MAEMQRPRKKRTMTPEAREKLSQLAKERHREGKFGGAQYGKLGGRPRKDRAAKRVAERAQTDEMAEQIIAVFHDAIQPNMPMNIRIKAAEAIIAVEREEAKVSMAEEDHTQKAHSREELIEILSGNLTEGPIAAILRRQIEPETGIVDAQVVEETTEAADAA